MASEEETGLVLSHTNHSHQLLFQADSNSGFPPNHRRPDRPAAGGGKAATGIMDHHRRYYQTSEFRQSVYKNWRGGNGRVSDSDGSDGDEDDDDVGGLVDSSNTNTSGHSSEKDGNVNMKVKVFGLRGQVQGKTSKKWKTKEHPGSPGRHALVHTSSSREVVKVGSIVPSRSDLNGVRPSLSENRSQGQVGEYQNNAVALVDRDGEMYYSQYLHGAEGSGAGLKDITAENGCGFSGRKDVSSYSGESGDSLRAILSDPLTGALMDDAMILPCGHSFGSGGMQHVMKMKACYTCSHPVSESSVASNLSLRSAVSAFRREEEIQVHHASKRRRERLDQDRANYGDSMCMDTPRGRGLQFPFSVADRVIIKGNKRTPERFVGCEAVVTTQCLNGWYVVKTLDNAESIKLQYRSLAKVSDDSSSHPTSSKMTPNWL
ncbi:hypothetical protein OSB04_025325 [Centaurea solstitialis]|uniref:U-box domain-containing protein n=1 Tax=Centaurea solstitialis TaxID=347529 RepID=A0AA38T7A3_9ASTR|nr:hypothetical protein OSB04_025325 [Centaurea solstitialis]